MRFIIPIVIILTFAMCTSKTKLIENCADKDFLKEWGIVEQFSYNDTITDEAYLIEIDFQKSIREGGISLQEKLNNTNNRVSYERNYSQCENRFSLNPETFKQKYK